MKKRGQNMHTLTLEVEDTEWEKLGKLAQEFDCDGRDELVRQSLNLTERFVSNNKRLPKDSQFAIQTLEKLRRFTAEGCHIRIIHPGGAMSAINLQREP